MLNSPQPWMRAVAEPHYLRRVQVRIRSDDEENVHEVHVPEVPPDPGPLPELRGGQEQHSEAAMLLSQTRIYSDGQMNYSDRQVPAGQISTQSPSSECWCNRPPKHA